MVGLRTALVILAVSLIFPFASVRSQDWNDILAQADSLSRISNLDSAIQVAYLALDDLSPVGTDERDTAAVLVYTQLGHFFRHLDQYDSSDHYYGEAITLGEQIRGIDVPLIVPALSGFARARANQRRIPESKQFYLRALEIQESVGTEYDPGVASLYTGLANVLRRAGQYDSAVALYHESIRIFEHLPDTFAVQTAQSLNGLGIAYKNSQQLELAEQQFLRARDIWTAHLGEYDYHNSMAYTNLGNLYRRMGRFDDAEESLRKCIEVVARSRGDTHRSRAMALHSLATLYQSTGRLWEAAEVQSEAVRIMEEIFGLESVRTAEYQNRLAMLYTELARYDDAEALFRKAHQIWEHTVGKTHRRDPAYLGNLAQLYLQLGRFVEAEEINRYHQAYVDSASPGDGDLRAWTRVTVATCCLLQDRAPEAEALLTEALDLEPSSKTVLGWKVLVITHRRLVDAYLAAGHWSAADSVLDGLCVMVADQLPGDPSLAAELQRLRGTARLRQGRYDQAVTLLDSSLQTNRLAFGRDHVSVAEGLRLLGYARAAAGDVDGGLVLAGEAVKISRQNLRRWAAAMSESDALKFSRRYRKAVNTYCTILTSAPERTREQTREAALVLLQGKGEVTDEVMRRQQSTRVGDLEMGKRSEALRIARYRLAQRFVQTGVVRDWEGHRMVMDSLSLRVRELEVELARTGQVDRPQPDQTLSFQDLVAALPRGGALVDYLRSTAVDPHRNEDHYFAVLVQADATVHVIPVGLAGPIDSLVTEYRSHIESLADMGMAASGSDQDAYMAVAGDLYQHLWEPVGRHLAPGGAVLISPDAALHGVSFAALPRDDGRYLIEVHEVRYLSAGRDLLREHRHPEPASGLLAMGDPRFDASPEQRLHPVPHSEPTSAEVLDAPTIRGVQGGCKDLQQITLTPLPSTRSEIELVAASWSETNASAVTVHLGAAATEDRLKQEVLGKAAVHLATHGYFIGGRCELTGGAGALVDEINYVADNPLLLSGLCLAGAAYEDETGSLDMDDGFLTAEEIAGLNLSGTELVVLSACESGLGQIADGEGVSGLRRAFLMAGAQTVVSSLWSVTDEDAAAQLSGLYEQSNRPVAERLRAIQLERLEALRAQGLPDHPVSWAAWVAVGRD